MIALKEHLKLLFIEIDSSTAFGRSIQRFRLVGLPSIPTVIVVAVCVWQLISYRSTLAGYQGMYDRAGFRYNVAQLVAKMDNERAAFLRDYLLLSNDTDRKRFQACVNRNNTEILKTIVETNEVLENFLKLPYIPTEQDLQSLRSNEFKVLYNSSAFMVHMTNFRNMIMNSQPIGCKAKMDTILYVFTNSIKMLILISPNFYDAELSKVTLMYVFALQHALESHQSMSSLCHLPYDYLNRGSFLNAGDAIDFALNFSSAVEARDFVLAMDESILKLYEKMSANRSRVIDRFARVVESILRDGRPNLTFDRWYTECRRVAQFYESFEDELSNEIKRNGFDLEWRNCVFGIIFYSMAIFLNIPAFVLIFLNSESTVRNLRQFSLLFQGQVDKLMEEKLKSEMLLCAMLPKSVVTKMEFDMAVGAETFESSTVFFSDVVDFNETILSALEPIQIVDLLNSLYGLLDSKIECFDVYKVETIGSVYMVVSGVPERNGRRHVTQVADMSLDLLDAINEQRFKDVRGKLELRIGIHTGPCVAGIVGNKMTRYCLFGDTINTASRMQSTGAASKIHLSEVTYLELDSTNNSSRDKYLLERRGTVDVKGKGTMTTYWLLGKNH